LLRPLSAFFLTLLIAGVLNIAAAGSWAVLVYFHVASYGLLLLPLGVEVALALHFYRTRQVAAAAGLLLSLLPVLLVLVYSFTTLLPPSRQATLGLVCLVVVGLPAPLYYWVQLWKEPSTKA